VDGFGEAFAGQGEIAGERLGYVVAGGGGDQRPGEMVGEVGLVPIAGVVRD
jgi:hypothetical protein